VSLDTAFRYSLADCIAKTKPHITPHRVAMLTGLRHARILDLMQGATPTIEEAEMIQTYVRGWTPIATKNPQQEKIR
jgi:hypothetical protein